MAAVRLAALLIGLLTGIVPMVLVYLVATIVLPEDGSPAAVAPVPASPGRGMLVAGIGLVAIGAIGVAETWLRVDWDLLWPAIAIVGGIALVLWADRSGIHRAD